MSTPEEQVAAAFNAYFANFPDRVYLGHDVEVAIGLSAFRFVGPVDIGVSLTLMRDLNRAKGITFVIVTHNEALSNQADRIIRMVDGQIA